MLHACFAEGVASPLLATAFEDRGVPGTDGVAVVGVAGGSSVAGVWSFDDFDAALADSDASDDMAGDRCGVLDSAVGFCLARLREPMANIEH